MNIYEIEEKMRELECFHYTKILPQAWAIIRVDGRSFSNYTKERFEKPFDIKFNEMMVKTSQILLEEFNGVYGYTESDEISILLPKNFDLFSRRVEKLVSISAGIASSAFSLEAGEPLCFDSRVWVGVSESQVIDYFMWRQSDASRCALNGWCYWQLRKEGLSAQKASSLLENVNINKKNEILFQKGINFNNLPLWQRRGVGIYWENYLKEGYNPQKDETVMTERRRQKINRTLPMKEKYKNFLLSEARVFNE